MHEGKYTLNPPPAPHYPTLIKLDLKYSFLKKIKPPSVPKTVEYEPELHEQFNFKKTDAVAEDKQKNKPKIENENETTEEGSTE